MFREKTNLKFETQKWNEFFRPVFFILKYS